MVGHHLVANLSCHLGVVFEELSGTFTPLPEMRVAKSHPRPALFNQFSGDRHIDDVTFQTDAVGMHHVELSDPEWWSHLVLDHLYSDPLTNHHFTIFECANATHVDAA